MNGSMYDKLLELPLFQGLSEDNLTNILEKVKVEFNKFAPEEYISRQNAKCEGLIFILDGKVCIHSKDSKHHFIIEEEIKGPHIIEPYSLFGMYTEYQSSYQAISEVNTLNIDKKYIISNLCQYEIFNMNYLNILSNRAQTMYNKLWNSHIGNTQEKILNFLLLRSTIPYGKKTLTIKMEDLASLTDDTRLNVSKALNELQDKDLISLSRKKIIIHDLRLLNEHVIKSFKK